MGNRKISIWGKANCIITAYLIEWERTREKQCRDEILKLGVNIASMSKRTAQARQKLRNIKARADFLEIKYACMTEGVSEPERLAI